MRPGSDDPLQAMFDTDLAWIGIALGSTLRVRQDLEFWGAPVIWLIPAGLIFGQLVSLLIYRSKTEII